MNATFICYWLPPLVWMVAVFPTNDYLNAGSTSRIIVPLILWFMPHADQGTIDLIHGLIRKCGHFLNYAFLAFLLVRAFRKDSRILRPAWILCSGLIALSYAGLDEYIQTRIQSRTGSFYDWLIDACGVVSLLGILIIRNNQKLSSLPKPPPFILF